MRKLLPMAFAFMLVFSLMGCSGATTNNSSSENADTEAATNEYNQSEENSGNSPINTKAVGKDTIKIEDIAWKVDEGVIDGNRRIVFSYVNNSDYAIVEIDMEFTEKPDLTKEDLSVFDHFIENSTYFNDDDKYDLYISVYDTDIVDPGEESKTVPCYIAGTYTYVENMDQYEIMEPSIMSIAFLTDNDTIYTSYYDFKTGSYGESSKGEISAHQWSDSALAQLLPEPNVRVLTVNIDYGDNFNFDAYGVSPSDFNEYVNECKTAGFVNVIFSYDDSYYASDGNGNTMYALYNSSNSSFNCYISPGKDDESDSVETD